VVAGCLERVDLLPQRARIADHSKENDME